MKTKYYCILSIRKCTCMSLPFEPNVTAVKNHFPVSVGFVLETSSAQAYSDLEYYRFFFNFMSK